MPAGNFTFYNATAKTLNDGTIDLDTDAFAVTLHTSAYVPNAEHAVPLDLTAEVANANGYVTGGKALTGITLTRTGAAAAFDSADVVWTAAGGSITARYAVLRNTTKNVLIGYALLDTTPADLTATDGNTLTVGPAATGWFVHTVNA